MTSKLYMRSDLLVESDWLSEHLDDERLLIVDCDLPDAYNRAHIPGSVNLGENHHLKGADNVHVIDEQNAESFFDTIGLLKGTKVVAYSGRFSVYAARLWWVLKYFGHDNVSILNGGWTSWLNEGRPITDAPTTKTKPSLQATSSNSPIEPFQPVINHDLIASSEQVLEAQLTPETIIWDVRSSEEFNGGNSRGNKNEGHVPGAINLEWSDLMDKKSGKFKTSDEIYDSLLKNEVNRGRPIITYCQAGVRAAHAMFTLTLMGYGRVKNYDASFAEWGNVDGFPIEK